MKNFKVYPKNLKNCSIQYIFKNNIFLKIKILMKIRNISIYIFYFILRFRDILMRFNFIKQDVFTLKILLKNIFKVKGIFKIFLSERNSEWSNKNNC